MKKLLPLALALFTIVHSIAQTTDSVSMTPGYAEQVFYNFENGVVHSSQNSEWELAFGTTPFNINIRINDGFGVALYLFPNGDTSVWNSVDTSGMQNWMPKYNSDTNWSVTAFTPIGLSHPDYGWGIYNSVTHNVVGDSIYIMKLTDGSYKKFKMNKLTTNHLFTFTYADIDGMNEVTDTVNKTMYNDKNFVYYDMNMEEVLDLDPPSSDWDVVFTKYMQLQPQGSFYPVTGVLANESRLTSRVADTAPEDAVWFNQTFETNIGLIGSNWKYFDMGTFTYKMRDSLSYFFADSSNNIWHLTFTGFDGSSTGNAYFTKEKMGALSTKDVHVLSGDVNIYPNPAVNNVNMDITVSKQSDNVNVKVYNITGDLIYQSNNLTGNQTLQLNISNWENGVYLIRIGNDQDALVKRLIKQ